MGFLLGPLGKAAMIAFAVMAIAGSVGLYLHSVRNAGRMEERAAEAAVAMARERFVTKNARDVDAEVSREASPQDELLKEWSRPDAH